MFRNWGKHVFCVNSEGFRNTLGSDYKLSILLTNQLLYILCPKQHVSILSVSMGEESGFSLAWVLSEISIKVCQDWVIT